MSTATENQDRYVVIAPCRDEEEFMRLTLDSLVAQTLRPALCLVVDDGSTDKTPEILAEYEAKYDFIKVFRRENRGFRSVGPGVVDTFYSGYKTINTDDFDYICKLDLDLELPPKYFEILVKRMQDNPRLGTCSGKPYNKINGDYVSERRGDEHSVGMTKFFRMSCFKQIGGFVREVNWDSIDSHKSRQLGWMVRSWDEPDLRFTHLRLMGSSQTSIYTGKMRYGFGQYYLGTDPLYLLASAVFRLKDSPFILGSLAICWGYFKCFFNGTKRQEDKKLIEFIRAFQWKSLTKGKIKAMEIFEKNQESEWDLNRPHLPMPIDEKS